MGIGTWNCLAQLQFVTFKILAYTIFKKKQYKKYAYQFREKITEKI